MNQGVMERNRFIEIDATFQDLVNAGDGGPLGEHLEVALRTIVTELASRARQSSVSIYLCSQDEDAPLRDRFGFLLAKWLRNHRPDTLLVDCNFAATGLDGIVPHDDSLGFLDLLLYDTSLRVITQTVGDVTVIGAGSFPVPKRLPFAMDAFEYAKRYLLENSSCVIFCGPAMDDEGNTHPIVASASVGIFVRSSRTTAASHYRTNELWEIRIDHPAVEPEPIVLEPAIIPDTSEEAWDEKPVEVEPVVVAIDALAARENVTPKRGVMSMVAMLLAASFVVMVAMALGWYVVGPVGPSKASSTQMQASIGQTDSEPAIVPGESDVFTARDEVGGGLPEPGSGGLGAGSDGQAALDHEVTHSDDVVGLAAVDPALASGVGVQPGGTMTRRTDLEARRETQVSTPSAALGEDGGRRAMAAAPVAVVGTGEKTLAAVDDEDDAGFDRMTIQSSLALEEDEAVAIVAREPLDDLVSGLNPGGADETAVWEPTVPSLTDDVFRPAYECEGTGLDGPFARPRGIFYESEQGECYVADTGNHRVAIFDEEGVPLYRFYHHVERMGKQVLGQPTRVVVDREGRMFLIDALAEYIDVLDFRGRSILHIQPPADDCGAVERFSTLAMGPDGHVAAVLTCRPPKVAFIDDKLEIVKLLSLETPIAERQHVTGLALDGEGRIYITDPYGPTMVQVYDSQGKFVRGFGRHDTGKENFSMPVDISVRGDGELWIVDAIRQVVSRFTPEGEFIGFLGGMGRGPGALYFPSGVATDGRDRVFVVERGGNRYQCFRTVDEQ